MKKNFKIVIISLVIILGGYIYLMGGISNKESITTFKDINVKIVIHSL